MNMTSVSSSNISAVGYDSSSNTLRVRFNNGRTYDYSNVPSNVYNGLMSASSHGGYHAANVKNSYSFTEL